VKRSIRTAAAAWLPALVLLAALAAARPAAAQPPAGPAKPAPEDPAKKPEPAAAVDEAWKPVEISVFMGSSIDSFAAADLKKYINPNESGEFREQLIAGFDFDYKLTRRRNGPGIWLYGETIHGARSGEVDCSKEANTTKDACKIARLEVASAQAPLAIFRKATTLEGFVGLRAELFDLGDADAPSTFYVKGQLGFLSVADKGGDIVDVHHVGIGIMLSKGPFTDSYFEFGYGRNDLFEKAHGRKKVDAFLMFSRPGNPNPKAKPFFQMCIDSDFGGGPDNIQTFFGLDINVLEIFK
jgi:hypothetical protein